MLDRDEKIALQRDCEVISVPYGVKGILKKGTDVQIMQAMGGSHTVYTDEGMFRISGLNSDAIGKEIQEPPSIPSNISDEEFESKIWEQMKTVYDPEIPINVVDLGLIYSCVINKNDSEQYSAIRISRVRPGGRIRLRCFGERSQHYNMGKLWQCLG